MCILNSREISLKTTSFLIGFLNHLFLGIIYPQTLSLNPQPRWLAAFLPAPSFFPLTSLLCRSKTSLTSFAFSSLQPLLEIFCKKKMPRSDPASKILLAGVGRGLQECSDSDLGNLCPVIVISFYWGPCYYLQAFSVSANAIAQRAL